MATAPALPFFYRETLGIRITVKPAYLHDHSQPARREFVFAYFVRIENVSQRTARLLSRRWLIHDSIGEEHEIVGDGVVGEQPTLAPGDVHEYQSFCVLKSPSGWMEGHYHFAAGDGSHFDAAIPRFILDVQSTSRRPA